MAPNAPSPLAPRQRASDFTRLPWRTSYALGFLAAHDGTLMVPAIPGDAVARAHQDAWLAGFRLYLREVEGNRAGWRATEGAMREVAGRGTTTPEGA